MEAARSRCAYGGDNLGQMVTQNRKLDRREGNDSDTPVCEILLMVERRIAGEQDFDASLFSGFEQFAICQAGPSKEGNCESLMRSEQVAQAVVEILIE